MDPLSITDVALSISTTAGELSQTIKTFMKYARKDMGPVLRELGSLTWIAELLANAAQDATRISDPLDNKIRRFLNGCRDVVDEIGQTLSDSETGNVIAQSSWGEEEKNKMMTLSERLEEYSMALELALDYLDSIVPSDTKSFTAQIKKKAIANNDDTGATPLNPEMIIGLIKRLENQGKSHPRDMFMLQRYLSELSNHPGTVYQDSVVSPGETKSVRTLDMRLDVVSSQGNTDPNIYLQNGYKVSGQQSLATEPAPDPQHQSDDSDSQSLYADPKKEVELTKQQVPNQQLGREDIKLNEYVAFKPIVERDSMIIEANTGSLPRLELHNGKMPIPRPPSNESEINPTSPGGSHHNSDSLRIRKTTSLLPQPVSLIPLPSSLSFDCVDWAAIGKAQKKRDAIRSAKERDALDMKLCQITNKTPPLEVQSLLESGADQNSAMFGSSHPFWIFNNAEKGFYPLDIAAMAGNALCVFVLLKFGAKVDSNGSTPRPKKAGYLSTLDYAALSGSFDSMRLLLEASAKPGQTGVHSAYKTALHIVASGTHECSTEMIELLVRYGANINCNERPYGTALFTALTAIDGPQKAMQDHLIIPKKLQALSHPTSTGLEEKYRLKLEIIEALLNNGADTNLPSNSHLGTTPLCTAIRDINEDWGDNIFKRIILDKLILHGARVHSYAGLGDRGFPLIVAIRSPFSPSLAIEYLFSQGASPKEALNTTKNTEFCTPLEAAAYTHQSTLLQRLLDLGANPIHAYHGIYGNPLHCAIAAMGTVQKADQRACAKTISLLVDFENGILLQKECMVTYNFETKPIRHVSPTTEPVTPRMLAKRVFLPKGVDRKIVFRRVLNGVGKSGG